MTKGEFINDYRCPYCQFEWYLFENEIIVNNDKLCEYCKKHPKMTNIEKIERYLSIMSSTNHSALPIMLREIWKVIKEIKSQSPLPKGRGLNREDQG